MRKQIAQVREFNKLYNVETAEEPKDYKTTEQLVYRLSLINEEQNEFRDAEGIEHRAEELVDLLYVTFGAVLDLGLQDKIEEMFTAKHNANLAKLHNGKIVKSAAGKILKPDNWKKPDFKSILENGSK
jgi:predicted HAD superfamily Cof-like phosphohydrolase